MRFLTKNGSVLVICILTIAFFLYARQGCPKYQHMALRTATRQSGPPHIVFIVADDLGWDDVGFHNGDVLTPNLDKWAEEGVILNSSYVLPMCTPSRSAFLTGYYPYHAGLQHATINHMWPQGVPLKYKFLPEELKKAGYKTHMVGKWHLGFCKWEYTPTYRGFDSFYGFYSANEDYFTHVIDGALDLRDNDLPDNTQNGTYSAHLFTRKAVEIIDNHDKSKPLFLYLPYQSVHGPLQVPEEYLKPYKHINDYRRRMMSGMITAMDEGIGNVTAALVRNEMLENLLLIFTSDNGGPAISGSSNWPLRGQKFTLWEGGTRAAAFIWSRLLKKTGYVNNRQIHAIDWFPTIMSLSGLTPEGNVDGVDQWKSLSEDVTTRTEFVYNIDEINKNGALRMGDYKLIEGNAGRYNEWYRPGGAKPRYHQWHVYMKQVMRDVGRIRLYNIKDDPTEHYDLASEMPDKVKEMRERLEEYRRTLTPSIRSQDDPKSDPARWGNTWSPGWC